MKFLFRHFQINKKAILLTVCFLLFPNSIPRVEAQGKKVVSGQEKKLITYNLEFNRSPIVGNRLRLRGIYAQSRLGFTRPRGWKIDNVKALIRFQHSPALYGNRSNLTVMVNDTAVGSIPLNRKQSQVSQMLVNIPPKLLQNYNELKLVAEQNTSAQCTDPKDPNLWTEVLPDSKLIFNFQRQPLPLNFSRYPYPFFDELGLETNHIVYLQPTQTSQYWLTAAARLQATFGRLADFRPLETSMVTDVTDVKPEQRLAIIGTPSEQPVLASLKLTVPVVNGQILDRNKNPIPEDTGVLIVTTAKEKGGGAPVLIATGNGLKGVMKAVQFLVQPDLRKIGTGSVILVNQVKDLASPDPREWSRYLPEANSFKLSDLTSQLSGDPLSDISVRGSAAPPIEIDFRALPDDRFLRGSSMNLVYSYSPQMNPRTSAVEVLIDDKYVGGARLSSDAGETRKQLKVDLPANLLHSNSKIQIFFQMNPKDAFDKQNCTTAADQQLLGTVHSDTSFDLKREVSVKLPDLKLLQFGFPFVAPQDLSKTAIVMPQNPSDTDILTLLSLSERLGRLSQANSVKLKVFTLETLPDTIRKNEHLIGIGTREKFPLPEVFKSTGLNLNNAFSRVSAQGAIQTPQDTQGMIKEIVSPWSQERIILALTAQTEDGLERVRQVIKNDSWFYQLQQDTALVGSDRKDLTPYDSNAYQLKFLQTANENTRVENTSLLSKISRVLQENWLLIPLGILGISFLLYGIVQLYLKRLTVADRN
ncbi:cellulose synthase [Scytonema hofmannii PCC 7110]|uniref:Cellulose synthase n=1 Tax=Scytonema hofmannii PCC 7110 TaxID=128403 RepID=A0A139WU58_9CYAN|nr:cellulose biosynthesis cyclic di-GMP-binding regulatory protein BcsB [Scytonema hofmannii]KYC35978.1 cellulose synthase [Scytonema hofmannii PCC 7110]